MKPRTPDNSPDLFRSQLSQIIDLSHPLVRLSERLDWAGLSAKIDVLYLTGSGQPPLPTRLLIGLHYLKAAYNESDESLVERWVENPYWPQPDITSPSDWLGFIVPGKSGSSKQKEAAQRRLPSTTPNFLLK